MSMEDVSRIKVNNITVGIVGLKSALKDMAKEFSQKSDEDIASELLKRLAKENWIPEESKERYGKAFVREFRKFMGQPLSESPSEGLEIKILGPGCARCNQLERLVMEVLAEMDLAAEVEHVTDVKEIGSYGVMGTPALIINGKVKSVGAVPPKERLKEWLTEGNVTKF
jgi:small redox-active disulfide protein 2